MIKPSFENLETLNFAIFSQKVLLKIKLACKKNSEKVKIYRSICSELWKFRGQGLWPNYHITLLY